MFAIAFDLMVAETAQHHPKGVPQAHADVGAKLAGPDYTRALRSLHITASGDLSNLFVRTMARKAL